MLKIKQIIKNCLSNYDLYYVVENADWSILADGNNIINNLKGMRGSVVRCDRGIRKKALIHYGSYNLFINKNHFPKNSERIIATCFHIVDGDERVNNIKKVDKYIGKWHTSCIITRNKLIENGVSPEKIHVIPIGVDTSKYKPAESAFQKEMVRKKYNIPSDFLVIGSFQKDGNGWEEGYEPKLIKGPDIFCNVIEKINLKIPVYVLLSGPARGYVKRRLDDAGIKYGHFLFENPDDVAELYNAIDLYIVTSREEGGPKAILESMASGIPIISTKVGMAPELIKNGENGFLVDIEDEDAIVNRVLTLVNDEEFVEKFKKNGLYTARENEIKIITDRYKKELYNVR